MATFPLKILTPDGVAYDGPAVSVSCRTINGQVQLLAKHIDFCTALGMGEAHIKLEDGTTRRAACGGVDLELYRTRQGCILRMRVGGQRFITLSGTVRPAKPIRAEWLLASSARPDNIRYTGCLTLSSKYRWMEEDAEPVSRLRLRLEG